MYKIQEQGEQAVATMMDVKDLLEWFYEIIIGLLDIISDKVLGY